jgi:hypothetical protein
MGIEKRCLHLPALALSLCLPIFFSLSFEMSLPDHSCDSAVGNRSSSAEFNIRELPEHPQSLFPLYKGPFDSSIAASSGTLAVMKMYAFSKHRKWN